MPNNDKRAKKLQNKMQKISAQQEQLAEDQKIEQIRNEIQQTQQPDNRPAPEVQLPVYDEPVYRNNIDNAMPGEIAHASVVSVEKSNDTTNTNSISSKSGVEILTVTNDIPENFLTAGEKDYLTDNTNEQNNKASKSSKQKKGSNRKQPIPAQNKKKIPYTAQDTIPYEYVYKNGIIETEIGTFTKSYLLEDVNFKIATDEEQENIFIEFGNLLNMFDSEMRAEITIFNRNVDRSKFRDDTLLKMKNDGLDKYRMENNAILESKMNEGKNNIFHEKYLTLAIKSKSIDDAVKTFQRIDAEVSAHIKRMNGVETFPMTLDERLTVLHEIYNPNSEVPLTSSKKINGTMAKAFDLDLLKKQGISSKDVIAPQSMEFKSDYFIYGDKFGRTLFIDNLPTFLSTDLLPELTDISCNMLASMHYEPIRQDKSMKMVKNQIVNINANVIDAQKRASKSGYSPDLIPHDLHKAQEEADRIMEDITSRNQKMFLMTIVCTVFADSLEELDKYTDTVRTTVSKFLCSLKKLNYQQEYGLTTALPLANNKLYIQRLLTTEAASVFIPFSAQELTQNNGMYYGLNAVSRNLILFNRLNSKNANGVILGTPGSGKSFAAKREIINVLLSTDDEVFIIDPEREYAPLAALFNGEVVRVAAGSKTYINPLDMDLDYADDDDPITLKSDFIGSLCETIIGGHYGLSPVQKSIIDRCVRKVYQPYIERLSRSSKSVTCDRSIMPTLNDFYQTLLAQPEPDAQNIALSLELYCHGSLDTFAHRTNVNTSSRFVVYDIKDIGSGMKEMGLQVCLNDIWNKIIDNKKRGKRTWFYIDEFYLLTQTDSSARFLQQIYKRARKWGGIPTGITQNVEDLLSSKEARGVINNCDFIMMLNQSPLDRAELGSMLNISPAQMSYITNSDAGQGLLYTGKFIIPFVDRFPKGNSLYDAMTTKPDEVKLDDFAAKTI